MCHLIWREPGKPEKLQELKRSIFENDGDIARRYNRLCDSIIDESLQCKDEINIIVVHATFAEWISKMIEGKLEKSEYCATSLVEAECKHFICK